MDNISLNAFAFPMNETDRGKASGAALGQVFFNNTTNFFRLEWVQIQYVFERQNDWFGKRIVWIKLSVWSMCVGRRVSHWRSFLS